MIEAILEFTLEVIGTWLGWRFCAPLVAAVILGFIIIPFVPNGNATTATVITLAVLGLGGGLVWRAVAGRN